MSSINLLTNPSRIETPFIKVQLGNYTFGVLGSSVNSPQYKNYISSSPSITYPNYIQSLSIKKINGQVNTYTLSLSYPITENVDPNFFAKVFSSVSDTRKIIFSYGDLEAPTFIYKNEEAIITRVRDTCNFYNGNITYTVEAVSSGTIASVGNFNFPRRFEKPSNVIKELLKANSKYGLQDLFTGMRDMNLVLSRGLIESDDKAVSISAKNNISILEYLNYLVNCMTPINDNSSSLIKSNIYAFMIVDDTTGDFDGSYFKVVKIRNNSQVLSNIASYDIDIGYPSSNIVTNFSTKNDETYSLYYKFSQDLQMPDYRPKINNQGDLTQVFAPSISSSTNLYKTTEADRSWWTKVIQYPISATITLKGLLRPAILMQYVRINIYFYGRKYINSGYYIITSQQDTISREDGYITTLGVTRIGGN